MSELIVASKLKKGKASRNNQGLTFCRPGFKTPNLQKTKVCPDCGFHVRGANHENGQHHLSGKNGRLTVK